MIDRLRACGVPEIASESVVRWETFLFDEPDSFDVDGLSAAAARSLFEIVDECEVGSAHLSPLFIVLALRTEAVRPCPDCYSLLPVQHVPTHCPVCGHVWELTRSSWKWIDSD